MKRPEHSKRVVVVAMILITLLYVVFGGLGYITYGDEIEGSITLNLLSLRVGACRYSVALLKKECFSCRTGGMRIHSGLKRLEVDQVTHTRQLLKGSDVNQITKCHACDTTRLPRLVWGSYMETKLNHSHMIRVSSIIFDSPLHCLIWGEDRNNCNVGVRAFMLSD